MVTSDKGWKPLRRVVMPSVNAWTMLVWEGKDGDRFKIVDIRMKRGGCSPFRRKSPKSNTGASWLDRIVYTRMKKGNGGEGCPPFRRESPKSNTGTSWLDRIVYTRMKKGNGGEGCSPLWRESPKSWLDKVVDIRMKWGGLFSLLEGESKPEKGHNISNKCVSTLKFTEEDIIFTHSHYEWHKIILKAVWLINIESMKHIQSTQDIHKIQMQRRYALQLWQIQICNWNNLHFSILFINSLCKNNHTIQYFFKLLYHMITSNPACCSYHHSLSHCFHQQKHHTV